MKNKLKMKEVPEGVDEEPLLIKMAKGSIEINRMMTIFMKETTNAIAELHDRVAKLEEAKKS